jgi:phosphohistidine phosphatase
MTGVARQLLLLRHAKSSWDDPSLPDHDRPLAPRGRKAARRLAAFVAESNLRPALVLCSSATRARETLDLIASSLGGPEIIVEERLYGASAAALLDRVRRVPDETDSVVLVGHNPGLQDLAVLLATPGADADRLAEKLPTGALVSFRVDGPWEQLSAAAAELERIVLPRELT